MLRSVTTGRGRGIQASTLKCKRHPQLACDLPAIVCCLSCLAQQLHSFARRLAQLSHAWQLGACMVKAGRSACMRHAVTAGKERADQPAMSKAQIQMQQGIANPRETPGSAHAKWAQHSLCCSQHTLSSCRAPAAAV